MFTLSDTDIEMSDGFAELDATMRDRDFEFGLELAARLCAVLPSQRPSDWVAEHVILDTPFAKKEPWTFVGREYMRDQIDDVDRADVLFQTTCAGTGSGKTTRDLAQMLWAFWNAPFSGLYIMPSQHGPGGATNFNNGNVITTVEASPCFQDMIPRGAKRHNFSGQKLVFAGNNLDFVGANSAAQVGNKRCAKVWLGEQDKMKEQLGREAGTDSLAIERTKGMKNPQVIRGSTPTLDSFGIWPHLLGKEPGTGSDVRRRFLPCPLCNGAARGRENPLANKGWIILVKDRQFTVLPDKMEDGTMIPLAQMRWDKEAKRNSGDWDIDRVIRSTRFECPHCGGHIRDEHRVWLDNNGIWIPTRRGEIFHRGYQMPSFYAPWVNRDFPSSWGGMAQKFLKNLQSGSGMKAYINSELAEVDVRQDTGMNRIEISTTSAAKEDWVPQITADFQKNWPYLWFIVRKWCAFKLLPPFGIVDGKPDFVEALEDPANAEPKAICEQLIGGCEAAWFALAEIMRFDSRTGRSPIIDYLLAQKITGEKLVKLYRDEAGSNTMDLRRIIYLAMGEKRPPRGGDSELVAAGHCALSGEYIWDEFKDVIKQFEVGKGMPVPNQCVAIDCGYAEQFNREVLRKCFESATDFKFYDPMSKNRPAVFYRQPIHNFCVPVPRDGWFALKGYPMNQRWNHGGIRNELNVNIEDPFFGGPNAGTAMVEVLELPSGLFWLRKDDLRSPRTWQVYSVAQNMEWFPKIHTPDGTPTAESSFRLADYEKHLNEQYYDDVKGKVEPRHGRGGSQSRAHPYHLDDCETYQVALATYHGFFDNEQRDAASKK